MPPAKQKNNTKKINERLNPQTALVRSEAIEATAGEGSVIELSFSSNAPIKQIEWWSGREYAEILDHSKDAVDLSRLNEIGSVLYNHDPSDPRNVVGKVISAWVDEKEGKCRAKIQFDDDDAAQLVQKKVTSGSIRGVSVGFRVYRWEEVEADGVSAEGIEGPAQIARKWEAYEISFAPVPADPNVGPGRSAKNNKGDDGLAKKKGSFLRDVEELKRKLREAEEEAARSEEEGNSEEDEEDDDEGEGRSEGEEEDDTTKDDSKEDDTERAIKTERRRSSAITSLCREFDVDSQEYIKRGVSLDVVRKEILEKVREERKPLPTSRSASAITINMDERDKFRSAVVDGLVLRSGVRLEKPAAGSEEFRGISLLDLSRLVLERSGERMGYTTPKMDIAGRAFSTSDFPAILSNIADKVLLAEYEEAPATWRAWCRTGNLRDFKEAHRLRMSEAPELELVPESGEYKMAAFSESEDTYRLETYGKKFALTRQMIINDDLGAFTRIPQLFGAASGRTINKSVYSLLLKNPTMKETGKALFSAEHKNLGTPAALSIESINAGRTAMRRQKGMKKDVTLNLYPSILLVAPELEMTAKQLLFSTSDIGQSNPAVINPFQNSFTIVVDPMITSSTEWYMIAAPSMIDTLEVAFLDGVEHPVVEQQPGWNTDGMEYKVRIDYGAKIWDYRGIYKNAGL